MRRWVGLALLFSLLTSPVCAAAADVPREAAAVQSLSAPVFPPGAGRFVLLVVDRLSVDDLTADPEPVAALRKLAERGGIALMNVRTAAQANSRNGYLTLGTGVRAQAGDWAGLALHAGERFRGEAAADLYRSLTGASPAAEIVHLGIAETRRIAALSDRTPFPGALGELLRKAGKRLSVYGNGDVQGEERRYAALIGMDALGLVYEGEVGTGLVLKDESWPGLERTDYDRLAARVAEAVQRDDLVVVDLADLARLEALSDQVDPGWYAAARKEALRRIDAFVAGIAALLDAQDGPTALMVVSPSPTKAAAEQGVLLAPVITAVLGGGSGRGEPKENAATGGRPGQLPAGLLMSWSTRRPGLVMNIDVAPAIASVLGVRDDSGRFDGGAIEIARQVDRPWEWLALEYARIAAVHSQRLSVIQPFFFAQMGIMLGGALLIWALARGVIRWSPALRRAWRLLLLAAFSFPLALLVLSPLEPAPLAIVWVRLALITAAIVALTLAAAKTDLGALGVLAGVTVAALLADMLFGAPLMAGSFLGYSPISGSRFYGIGNEYMGILIGSSFVLAGAYLDRKRRPGRAGRVDPAGRADRAGGVQNPAAEPPRKARAPKAAARAGRPAKAAGRALVDRREAACVVACFLAVTAFLAAPGLGINVGGTITAVVGFGYFLLALFGRRFTVTRAALLGLLVLAVLVAIGLLDGRFGGGASHLGQTVQKVGQQGADPLWTIFERKVNVNLRLIRLTIWSRVVLLSLGVLALFVFWPGALMSRMKRRYPFTALGLRGAFVAALATLVVNDSGIVAAATLLLPATLVALLLLPGVAAGLARGGEEPQEG